MKTLLQSLADTSNLELITIFVALLELSTRAIYGMNDIGGVDPPFFFVR